ncbi:hypothetical protein AB0O31_20030 [Kitasatospora cineracea]|uniref:hypothetical protein n=1 Tax=Kitasatospora cineracea TaxID=88074 RepID=UPI003425B038
MTIVVETAVACAVAWALRKARRVGQGADAEVDYVLDAAMDRVHQVVVERLGSDGDVARLEQEAEFACGQSPEQAERMLTGGFTRHNIENALTEAVDTDSDFAAQLETAVTAYRNAVDSASPTVLGSYGLTVGGNLMNRADNGSVAAAVLHVEGGLHLGNPSKPGSKNH